MKRFIIAAIAASALAMPSAASADAGATAAAPCTSPIVYCVEQLLERISVDPTLSVCQYGETYSECAFRIVRDAPDDVLYLLEAYVDYAGYVAGSTIDRAKYLCSQVIRTCGTL